MNPTQEEVCKLVSSHTGKAIGLETKLEDVGLDSLDTIEMLGSVEDRFNIRVTALEIVELNTVLNISDLVERKQCLVSK